MTLFGPLRRFAGPARRGPKREGEHCEICDATIGEHHRHVVELADRTVHCACGACAVLFVDPAAAGGRYRTIPDRVLVDPELQLTDATWAALGIPVRLAFIVRRRGRSGADGADGWMAYYPSPAGPTEAELSEAAWSEALTQHALLRALEPDVEALLVQRHRDGRIEALLVPISTCYELVAAVRAHWRGFDGGDEARRVIEEVFVGLRGRARPFHALREADR